MASFVNSPPELRFFTRENINLLTRRRMIVPERGGEREADRRHTWWMGFCASSKAQQDTRIRPSFFKPPTICIYRNVFWGTLNITQMPSTVILDEYATGYDDGDGQEHAVIKCIFSRNICNSSSSWGGFSFRSFLLKATTTMRFQIYLFEAAKDETNNNIALSVTLLVMLTRCFLSLADAAAAVWLCSNCIIPAHHELWHQIVKSN